MVDIEIISIGELRSYRNKPGSYFKMTVKMLDTSNRLGASVWGDESEAFAKAHRSLTPGKKIMNLEASLKDDRYENTKVLHIDGRALIDSLGGTYDKSHKLEGPETHQGVIQSGPVDPPFVPGPPTVIIFPDLSPQTPQPTPPVITSKPTDPKPTEFVLTFQKPLARILGTPSSQLIEVFTAQAQELHPEFTHEATEYWEDNRRCFLPPFDGKVIVLAMEVSVSGRVFNWFSIRKWTAESEAFYRAARGKTFKIVIEV